ncbi:MAG: 2-amino-4-hydroxy-6-hydroxymethyldihydropteridine diphosphokinase [Candidatus Omnitrophica bacterium]|nr:2-amino-4-hydroxy-6-hydroxymethyldihydropteridine diphosphokinase [Candidatus Omnitrophota bacterium]
MNRVIIALGSNIEPDTNIQKTKEILVRKYHVLTESCFKTTKSVGDVPQADFINGNLLLETESAHTSLKAELKTIEAQLGRDEKHSHETPRTIDLDIVLWNEAVINQDFYERDYLKESVLELVPDLKY